MGAETKIQWTRHTQNFWIGCEKVSPGCAHCYAEVSTGARVSKSRGLPLWGPQSHRHLTAPDNWKRPLAWYRAAVAAGERHRVFCQSLSDFCEDRRDLDEPRAWACELMRLTCPEDRQAPGLDWLLLTKRPENLRRLVPDDVLRRCWVGTTAEDQRRFDERWPHLRDCPAAVRFLSVEPMLGRLDAGAALFDRELAIQKRMTSGAAMNREQADAVTAYPADWLIVGGESGPGARPCDVEWIRDLVQQCKRAGLPVFVKQLGSHVYESVSERTRGMGGIGLTLRDRKGGDPAEWPSDLRVREWPR